MIVTRDDVQDWKDRDVLGREGDKIGTVEDIYLDAATGRPEWLAVKAGIFGTRSRLVPIGDARLDGQGVIVTETKDVIKDAPDVTLDGDVSEAKERELYDYYDLSYESTGNRRFSRL